VLSVEQVAERLEHSFRLLTTGPRTALPRHQTLGAALDWSYDLLAPAEQALFRQLAVFAGGFTLEAAEQVSGAADRDAAEVLDVLARLVDKSLVLAPPSAGGRPVRYRLLEPLRQYAHERLAASGALDAPGRRHAQYYLALAARAEPELRGPQQVAWLGRLDEEHDNLRAALAWCQVHDAEMGLRLAVSLGQFWDSRGYTTEGTRWLMSLLPADRHTLPHAWALYWAGYLVSRQGATRVPIPLLEESLALFRVAGERAGAAATLERLGLVVALQGEYARGRQLLEESLAGFRALGDKAGMSWTLATLGMLSRTDDAYVQTRAYLEESQRYMRELGDRRNLAFTLNNLGQLARVERDYEQARALLEESLELAREAGDKHYIGWTLQCLGDVARRQGDDGRAWACLSEALIILERIHGERHVAQCLCLFAFLFAPRGEVTHAARLIGAALALQEHVRATMDADERADLDATLDAAQATLGAEAFARAWAEGQALTLTEAAAYALALPAPE
jgi:tetratricopeptide (TPR) repeat protein